MILSRVAGHMGLLAVLWALVGCTGPMLEPPLEPVAEKDAIVQAPLEPTPTPLPPPVFEGALKKRQTLSEVLSAIEPLPAETIREIIRALSTQVDLRQLRPGNHYRLELTRDNKFQRFFYVLSPEARFVIEPVGNGLQARRENVDVEIRPQVVEGTITSTLVEAVLEQGESINFAMGILDAFQWDINFYTDVRKGDKFSALVEKVYVDGEVVRIGRVLVGTYDGSFVGHKDAILFKGDHYDSKGIYLQKSWLTTPLNTLRITSRFGQRFHPVLKRSRPHRGVDYGARRGTPVWSVANGTVAYAGNRRDGYGKQVLIRHTGGYSTRYAHLHRISVKRGQKVKQKKKIGEVGSTGLASGPHLHFEILINGKQVNPARIKMLPTVKRKVKEPEAFQTERRRLLELMNTIEVVVNALPIDASVRIY